MNQPTRIVMVQSVLGTLASHQLVVFPMPKKLTYKLDRIQRNFWWNKNHEGKGFFPKKWDVVAKPKALGGLNIKKTADLNNALLTKLAWRMLTEKDAEWVKILSSKYYPNNNPLHAGNAEGSWVWKGICRGLEIIKKNYCCEVGNGKNISKWKDIWVPTISGTLPSRFMSSNIVTVDQLMIPNSSKWNTDLLKLLFDNNIVTEICKIRIPLSGEDKLICKPAENGIFSAKTSYRVIDDTINTNSSSDAPPNFFP